MTLMIIQLLEQGLRRAYSLSINVLQDPTMKYLSKIQIHEMSVLHCDFIENLKTF